MNVCGVLCCVLCVVCCVWCGDDVCSCYVVSVCVGCWMCCVGAWLMCCSYVSVVTSPTIGRKEHI